MAISEELKEYAKTKYPNICHWRSGQPKIAACSEGIPMDINIGEDSKGNLYMGIHPPLGPAIERALPGDTPDGLALRLIEKQCKIMCKGGCIFQKPTS